MPTVSQENKNLNPQTLKNLPREQKIAVVFLVTLTILIVGLWCLQFRTQINKPFGLDSKANKTNTASGPDQSMKDSDGDGILDYEEVNLYHTSPYLEDSDSDGISDKQEVAQGADPNCPAGKDCNSAEATSNANNANANASSTVDILDFGALGIDALGTSTESTATPGGITEVTPAMIRAELLKSGVEQAALDKISDEELIKIYEESVNKQAATE